MDKILRVCQGSWISVGRYVLMVSLVPIFITPILFMLSSSLKPWHQLIRDLMSIRAILPVGEISLDNYREAFRRAPVLLFIFNSVMVTSLTVLFGIIVNSLAGFSITYMRWKGKDIILMIIIATLIVPFEAFAIPLLLIVSRLPWVGLDGFTQGWLNSYHVQILPFVANSFSIYLFVQHFKSLPQALVDAARIDGASWFQLYLKVVIPLSGPVIATVAILTALPMWNQYLWPVMVIQMEKYRPVMIGAKYFYQSSGEIMAYLSIITIPILTLFLGLQQSFMESLARSGIKGA
jgi:multiple sugar transport system permease protein